MFGFCTIHSEFFDGVDILICYHKSLLPYLQHSVLFAICTLYKINGGEGPNAFKQLGPMTWLVACWLRSGSWLLFLLHPCILCIPCIPSNPCISYTPCIPCVPFISCIICIPCIPCTPCNYCILCIPYMLFICNPNITVPFVSFVLVVKLIF